METLAPLYKMSDVTAYLGVTDEAVKRYIKSGDLQAVKMGRDWRFTPEQLQSYISKRTVSRLKKKSLKLA